MARDALKWREPWRAYIARQPRFNPLGREVLWGFAGWLMLFVAMMVIARWGRSWNRDDVDLAGGMALLAFAMAVSIELVHWLSARSFEFIPPGILITKGSNLMVLPWSAIAGFEIRHVTHPPVLALQFTDGSSDTLLLSDQVSRSALEAELRRMIPERTAA